MNATHAETLVDISHGSWGTLDCAALDLPQAGVQFAGFGDEILPNRSGILERTWKCGYVFLRTRERNAPATHLHVVDDLLEEIPDRRGVALLTELHDDDDDGEQVRDCSLKLRRPVRRHPPTMLRACLESQHYSRARAPTVEMEN